VLLLLQAKETNTAFLAYENLTPSNEGQSHLLVSIQQKELF